MFKAVSTASVLIPLLLTGCTSYSQSYGPKEPKGVAVSDGWQQNEKLYPAEPITKYSVVALPAHRGGATPTGFPYRMYPDGSGGVSPNPSKIGSGWSIDCSKDAMSDKRNCKISSGEASLIISYTSSFKPSAVCIIGHNFPGRSGAIRVGTSSPKTTDNEGCVSGGFVSQLSQGSTVTVRSVKWPNDWSFDNESSLSGLQDAISLAKFMHENIDKLPF